MENRFPYYTEDEDTMRRGVEYFHEMFGSDPIGETETMRYRNAISILEIAEFEGVLKQDRPARQAWLEIQRRKALTLGL